MCQTPFQEPDTILFNPHDLSQREVMILHIFHRWLRLRYVKVVHGGVQQRGVSCREGSLADIQFSIRCTIQRMESHLTSEAPESYRDITQCWHLRHCSRLRSKKMRFGPRSPQSYLINDCTQFFPPRPAPLRRHPGVLTAHLWPLWTWRNHMALRRQKQRAPVNRPAIAILSYQESAEKSIILL